MMLPESITTELKETLECHNVCKRCILRFLLVKEYSSYIDKISIFKTFEKLLIQKENTIANGSNTEVEENVCSPPKRLLPSPCICCLGILQDFCSELLSKVQMAVTESHHVFDDFVLQLSIPVVVDLRDQMLYFHLKEKFKDNYPSKLQEIATVKDVLKWVIGSQLGEATKTDFKPDSDFQIAIAINYADVPKECFPLYKKSPESFPNRRKSKAKLEQIYTRTAVLKAMEVLSSEIEKLYEFPPSTPVQACSFQMHLNHSPIYLGGRYNKYSRELPQTPWVVDGERRMDSSVNELITDIVEKWISCDKIIFSASGREDVDVKMLGNGRPFVLEVINPRKAKWTNEEMQSIQNEINDNTKLISVNNLQVISKKDTLLLKEGEEQKTKTYSALCTVKKKLSKVDVDKLEKLQDLKLNQKTPIRVLHRRTLATREKLIHSIKAEILSDHRLLLRVNTQAGTYVKEFVHGDFGRTLPSIGTLLDTEADILELDVESIELDWPPNQS